jgi:hypothetical protein
MTPLANSRIKGAMFGVDLAEHADLGERLDQNSRLDLDLAVAVTVPGPRRAQDVAASAPV